MEDTRQACELKVKREIEVANNYGKHTDLMLLCYDMLCYALQGVVPKLSFLAKLTQPNGYNEQMVLVDPLEGDKLDTPTTHRHLWHGLDHGPAHNHNHSHDQGPDYHGLSNHDPNFGPQHLTHVHYSSTT